MKIYENLTDRLMQFYTGGTFKEEAVKARQEFYDLAGIFDESSIGFEMKMAQFVDWYLFTRKLTSYGLTPAQLQLEKHLMEISDEEAPFYQNLAANRHSLFEFIKLSGKDLKVRDIFSDYKLTIKDSPVVHGFSRDELFEARLIPHEDSFIFSGAFCMHPNEALKFINSEVKKVKKLSEDEKPEARVNLLMRLFKMRHKFDQYKHVSVADIYSNESRVRV